MLTLFACLLIVQMSSVLVHGSVRVEGEEGAATARFGEGQRVAREARAELYSMFISQFESVVAKTYLCAAVSL